jgi:hypothetical protein
MWTCVAIPLGILLLSGCKGQLPLLLSRTHCVQVLDLLVFSFALGSSKLRRCGFGLPGHAGSRAHAAAHPPTRYQLGTLSPKDLAGERGSAA